MLDVLSLNIHLSMKKDRLQLLIPHPLSPITALSHAFHLTHAQFFLPCYTLYTSTHIKFFVLPCSEPPATPGSAHMGWVENWLENGAQTQELSKDENSQCCRWETLLLNRSPRLKTRSRIFNEADSQVTNCVGYRNWTAVPLSVCPFT